MRYFKPGDIVFIREFNDHQGDWVLNDGFPYMVIEYDYKYVKIMGGKNGETLLLPASMLIDDEEARILTACYDSAKDRKG